ncbi:MAG: hypothetical protein WCA81_06820 [Rhizomicrobium sp.]
MLEQSEDESRKPAYIQKRENSARSELCRQWHEDNIAAIDAVADELATDRRKNDANERKRALREKVTIALLVGTVVAAGVGDWIFYRTMDDSKSIFISGSRAWISPISIGLAAPIEKGKPLSIGLQYENVGRLPAFDLREHYTLESAPDAKMEDGSAMATIGKADICAGVEPFKDAEVAYPNSGGARLTISVKPVDSKTGRPVELYDSFLSGNHTLIVQFCIAYKTLETTHKSAFCYFYRPGYTVGIDFNRCDKGNHAN